MFIEAHPTPNINSLKFHPGRAVLDKGTMDFPNAVRQKSFVLILTLNLIHKGRQRAAWSRARTCFTIGYRAEQRRSRPW